MFCTPSTPLLRTALLIFLLSSGCHYTNGWVMNSSGQAYYRRGNYTAARYDFERALMDRPLNASYAYNLARATERQGNIPEAEKMYQHALTLQPNHAPSYTALSDMLIAQGRSGEAVQLMQAWADTQPYSGQARTGLASVQRKTGDYMGAEQNLQAALKINPRQPQALNEMALLSQQTGNSQQAMKYYEQSLAINPYQEESRSQMMALRTNTPATPGLQMAANMPQQDPSMAGGGAIFAGGFDQTSGGVLPAGGFASQPMPMQTGSYSSMPPAWGTESAYSGTAPMAMTGPTMTASPMPMSAYPTTGPMLPVTQGPYLPGVAGTPLPQGQPALPSVNYGMPAGSASAPQVYSTPVQLGQPVPVTGLMPTTTMPAYADPTSPTMTSPAMASPTMVSGVMATPAF